jgi:predicted enzyme related to lactoylglutathione lyase
MSEESHLSGPRPKHGEFCWAEIGTSDLPSTKSFFANVFGWQFHAGGAESGEFQYLEFSSSGQKEPDGGMYELNPKWFGGTPPPPHIAAYVAVDDVDAAAAKAVELGGSIPRPPSDIPNVGRMCVIADPSGAAISMVTLLD